jgi:uncharacterized membrane-anchored protein YitT (DUF2179 family)
MSVKTIQSRKWRVFGRVGLKIEWRTLQRLFIIAVGSIIAALGFSLFQLPYNLAAGGVSGLAVVISPVSGIPAGTVVLLLNIPLLVLGYFYLGRWRFLGYTLFSVLLFSFAVDFFASAFAATATSGMLEPLTDDMLLSAVYAGIVVGLGNGLVFRGGATMGGTNVIGRMMQLRTGIPLSQVYLYTDGVVILLSALVFGWDAALHAMLALFLAGLASDFAMEGPSTVRAATIVTNKPEEVTEALRVGLRRGASHWDVTGSYTGQKRSMVFCTITRSQVNDLKYIMANTDPEAFVVIGEAHQALGGGFTRLRS